MFRLQSISIAQRLGLLIGSSILGIVALSAVFLWSERTLVMEERQLGVRQTVETAPVRLDSKPRCESYQFRANPPITGNFDTIAKVKPLTALKSVNLTVFYSSVL